MVTLHEDSNPSVGDTWNCAPDLSKREFFLPSPKKPKEKATWRHHSPSSACFSGSFFKGRLGLKKSLQYNKRVKIPGWKNLKTACFLTLTKVKQGSEEVQELPKPAQVTDVRMCIRRGSFVSSVAFLLHHTRPSPPMSHSQAYLSDTGATAAAEPSCWESGWCRWARNRIRPLRCSGSRSAGWRTAAHPDCSLWSESLGHWWSLEGAQCVWAVRLQKLATKKWYPIEDPFPSEFMPFALIHSSNTWKI